MINWFTQQSLVKFNEVTDLDGGEEDENVAEETIFALLFLKFECKIYGIKPVGCINYGDPDNNIHILSN